MDTKFLDTLIDIAAGSPKSFQETAYWERYRKELMGIVKDLDINELRSGKYPQLATFGFNEFYPKKDFRHRLKVVASLIKRYLFSNKPYAVNAPYSITAREMQEMAYRYCVINEKLASARGISSIQASTFGNPGDVFEIKGRTYTMAFLNYYVRYCFAQKNISFKGDEFLVELGSGSGHQAEVFKKLYPELTIICFDLPVPLFIGEQYLSHVLDKEKIVSIEETITWTDLSKVKKGCVHFFGNWQFPLIKDFKFDIFWNAASFGEMEPAIVKNYLSFILGNCSWIYLLQARLGKGRVEKKIRFEDYDSWLNGYKLINDQDAYTAFKKLVEESEYFEAIWKLNGSEAPA